ncbi:MAG: DUF692 domain-containing protein [Bdellovibrionales bacterium]
MRGIGLSYRLEFEPWQDRLNSQIDFYEVVVDHPNSLAVEKFLHATSKHPRVLHAMHLSPGQKSIACTEDFEMQYAACLERFQTKHLSDHLCFVGSEQREIPNFVPIPFLEEAVKLTADRIKSLKRRINTDSLSFENICYYFKWPHSMMSEAEFISRVLQEADCSLLLDVNNLHVNACNHGYDPIAFIETIPKDRISYLHVAGHSNSSAGIKIDSHDAPVAPEVWKLFEYAVRRTGATGCVLERDLGIDSLNAIHADLDIMASLWRNAR